MLTSVAVMSYPPNTSDGNADADADAAPIVVPDLSGLSLAEVADSSASAAAPTTPGLNILNQACEVTPLNANNTSFDPRSQQMGMGAAHQQQHQAADEQQYRQAEDRQQHSRYHRQHQDQQDADQRHQHQQQQHQYRQHELMVPSFLTAPSNSNSPTLSSVAFSHHQQQHQHRLPSPIPTQSRGGERRRPVTSRGPQQQQQQQGSVAASSSYVSASSSGGEGGGGATPAPRVPHQGAVPPPPPPPQQQMHLHHMHQMQQREAMRSLSPPFQPQQQQPMHHPPVVPPPGYDKKEYYSNDATAAAAASHKRTQNAYMSGRVPATRRDGRKLFVGGLPNGVSDLSFLQFFQQYGEVIDSVVLLDRRTKRSRGFGFVTFADPNVAASLLTTIPGRTGMVSILGKNCEVKASEPKTAETANLAPPHRPNDRHQHHNMSHAPHGWNAMPQHQQPIAFGPSGTLVGGGNNPPPNMPVPPHFVRLDPSGVAGHAVDRSSAAPGGVGAPVYSHSTITRADAPPPGVTVPTGALGSSPDGGPPVVYVQNNFYTLPPGTAPPPGTEPLRGGEAASAGGAGRGAEAEYVAAYSGLGNLYRGATGSGEADGATGGGRSLHRPRQTGARGHRLPYE